MTVQRIGRVYYLPMDDLDAYRCAKLLIDARGSQEAWRHAVERAVELKGDKDGQLAWARILAAIEVLGRMERRDEEFLQ